MAHPFCLQDVRVVSTRPLGRSNHLRTLVEDCGGCLLERPLIQIIPRQSPETEQSVMQSLSKTVVVTSANAIRSVRFILEASGAPWPPSNATWYCISRSTAKVAVENGLLPIVFDDVKTGLEFANVLTVHLRKTGCDEIVFLRGEKADSTLVDGLESAGIRVLQRIVYDTVNVQFDVDELKNLNDSNTVVYTLFSPSAVESLVEKWPDFNRDRTKRAFVVTIGKTTAAACQSFQIHVDGVSNRPTEVDLANKIQEVISLHTMFGSTEGRME